MTSAAEPEDRVTYLDYLRTLSYKGLKEEEAEIDGQLSQPETAIGDATIRRFVPSDVPWLAKLSDINYVLQRRIDEADRSAREAVSKGAGKNSEACARLWASKAGQTTTRSTVQCGQEATVYHPITLCRKRIGRIEINRIWDHMHLLSDQTSMLDGRSIL